MMKYKNEGCDHPKCFGHQLVVIKHAPTCSLTFIEGGYIHFGFSLTGKHIHKILFWSGRPNPKSHKYDLDLQETKLTVTIKIICHL